MIFWIFVVPIIMALFLLDFLSAYFLFSSPGYSSYEFVNSVYLLRELTLSLVNIFNFLNFIYFFSNLYYLFSSVKFGFSLFFFNSLRYRVRIFATFLASSCTFIAITSPLEPLLLHFTSYGMLCFYFCFSKIFLYISLQFLFWSIGYSGECFPVIFMCS